MQTTNDAIVALKLILEDDRKHKTLERALALTDLNSFYYYDNTGAEKKKQLRPCQDSIGVVHAW